MPTPTGLLCPSDILVDPDGREWIVTRRSSNDACYSVRIRPHGWTLPFKKEEWLPTAAWYLKHGWKIKGGPTC